jgi:hypothetical protein
MPTQPTARTLPVPHRSPHTTFRPTRWVIGPLGAASGLRRFASGVLRAGRDLVGQVGSSRWLASYLALQPPLLLTLLRNDGQQAVIDDTLYQMYAPPAGREPVLDVVFFHGLQLGDYRDAWWKTWLLGGSGAGAGQGPAMVPTCWPRTLLGADFPDARVLSVCYDASARRTGDQGRLDLTSLGERLANALLRADVGGRPLVLVGHSLGGLMLQQVCLSVDGLTHDGPNAAVKYKAAEFLGNVLGAAFYSSPLAGSRLSDLAKHLGWLAALGPVMSTLRTLSLGAHRVTVSFGNLRKREREKRPGTWATLGLCETKVTSLLRVGDGCGAGIAPAYSVPWH